MLAFVTSLRHPWNSADYSRVEALLEETLRSVLRQNCPDFTVWVVGNQRPSGLPQGVRFVGVDFPPPSELRGPHTGRSAVLLDKGTKLAMGVMAALASAPDHIMLFDADDMVSRRLASLSHAEPDAPGWYVQEGWRWAAGRRSVRPQRNFSRTCGTAHIVRADLFPMPAELHLGCSRDDVVRAMGSNLDTMYGSHVYIREELRRQGHVLAPIPFPAALYRVGTGENHSGISMGGFGRPVSRAVSREFGVPATSWAPTKVAQAVLPSRRAFTERLGCLWHRAPRS